MHRADAFHDTRVFAGVFPVPGSPAAAAGGGGSWVFFLFFFRLADTFTITAFCLFTDNMVNIHEPVRKLSRVAKLKKSSFGFIGRFERGPASHQAALVSY